MEFLLRARVVQFANRTRGKLTTICEGQIQDGWMKQTWLSLDPWLRMVGDWDPGGRDAEEALERYQQLLLSNMMQYDADVDGGDGDIVDTEGSGAEEMLKRVGGLQQK